QHQKDADNPIELARFLVGAGQEHSKHVQPYSDDHQVRRPAMHIPKESSEGDVVLKVENVPKRLNLRRMVIKHQKRSGERQDNKEVKRDATHSPRIIVGYCIAVDLGRMEVQKDVREHSQGATAGLVIVFDSKNGLIKLSLFGILQSLH